MCSRATLTVNPHLLITRAVFVSVMQETFKLVSEKRGGKKNDLKKWATRVGAKNFTYYLCKHKREKKLIKAFEKCKYVTITKIGQICMLK